MRVIFVLGLIASLPSTIAVKLNQGPTDLSQVAASADTQMLGALAGAMGGGGAPPAPDGPTQQNAPSINIIDNNRSMVGQ